MGEAPEPTGAQAAAENPAVDPPATDVAAGDGPAAAPEAQQATADTAAQQAGGAAPEPVAPAVRAAAGKAARFQPSLRTGQRCVLQGLEKARELNGHRGVIVKWKADVGRYAVRVAGKEMAIKPENLTPEGGAAEAAKFQKKHGNTVGLMYNPVVYARTPGAGPKMTQWIGQVKAGQRCVVRAEKSPSFDDEPVPLWFGDQGFVRSAPVDVAVMINDIGADVSEWPKALARVLEHFPAAAGRLRQSRRDNQMVWQIVPNNAGVPFTTASVQPCGLPSAEDLQLACTDDQCGLFDLDTGADNESDGGVPLLRMKLVYEEGTAKGILGVTFNHALCDISGIGMILRRLHSELDATQRKPDAVPCHNRSSAQEAFDAVPDATPEEESGYTSHWPLWPPALERWCFFARRLRAGLRGRPDGAATVFFSVPASTLTELKSEAEAGGAAGASSFEVLVCYLGMKLLRLGRQGRRTLITKDYRAALNAAAPDRGFDRLFANVVTHGLSFDMPSVCDEQMMPLAEACAAMRKTIDAVDLGYVRWHSKQNHFRGLPNFFGGLCCNTWGHALDMDFIETYAIGMRAVDERAENMSFPLNTAYMQVLPLPSGSHTVLLTMPVTEISLLLKELPASHFEVPRASDMRTHAFKVPLPGKLTDRLNPSVETHHMFARIACIGDSMTSEGYPKYLQQLFDRAEIRVEVRNYGAASSVVQKSSFDENIYWEKPQLEKARIWRPHFVISTFGHNDSKPNNWDSEMFEKDYADLCIEFLERNSPKPHVFLVVPPPLYKDGEYEMQQDIVNAELPAAVPRVAASAERTMNAPIEAEFKRMRKAAPAEILSRTGVIDAFGALGGAGLARRGYFAEDGVHPNERGTRLLAMTVFAEIRREVCLCLRKWADAASVVPQDPMDM